MTSKVLSNSVTVIFSSNVFLVFLFSCGGGFECNYWGRHVLHSFIICFPITLWTPMSLILERARRILVVLFHLGFNERKREAKEAENYNSPHLAIRIGIGNLVTK